MNSIKKALDKIFIEGLSAMAQGLFATLIIGTIIQQIGNLIPGQLGTLVFMAGKILSYRFYKSKAGRYNHTVLLHLIL